MSTCCFTVPPPLLPPYPWRLTSYVNNPLSYSNLDCQITEKPCIMHNVSFQVIISLKSKTGWYLRSVFMKLILCSVQLCWPVLVTLNDFTHSWTLLVHIIWRLEFITNLYLIWFIIEFIQNIVKVLSKEQKVIKLNYKYYFVIRIPLSGNIDITEWKYKVYARSWICIIAYLLLHTFKWVLDQGSKGVLLNQSCLIVWLYVC